MGVKKIIFGQKKNHKNDFFGHWSAKLTRPLILLRGTKNFKLKALESYLWWWWWLARFLWLSLTFLQSLKYSFESQTFISNSIVNYHSYCSQSSPVQLCLSFHHDNPKMSHPLVTEVHPDF